MGDVTLLSTTIDRVMSASAKSCLVS